MSRLLTSYDVRWAREVLQMAKDKEQPDVMTMPTGLRTMVPDSTKPTFETILLAKMVLICSGQSMS